MKILLRNGNHEQWKLVETAAYGNESELQHLLAESPGLISIQDIRENAGSLLVAIREFSLPIGYVDLLAFSAGGDIAVIECKLASSSEVKRKVIGQVLEYGSYIWQMSYEELDQGIRLRAGESLAELMAKAVQDPDWDEENFRSTVETTLSNGNFILVIVVDEINEELSHIVNYMNVCGNQGFDFAALEMRRYHSAETEMLIPRLFGPTFKQKPTSVNQPSNQWDESSFLAELQNRHGDQAVTVAKQLLQWSKIHAALWWGKGKQSGSFVPFIHHKDILHQLFAVWTYGTVEIYFQWYQYKPAFDSEEKRIELLNKLNQIEGVNLPINTITKRPSIPFAILAEVGKLDQFLAIYDWVLSEIRKS
jgi:hypothetical protein